MKIIKQLTALTALAAALASAVAPAAEPLKVAFLHNTAIASGGWTYAHDQGRQYVEKKFGNKIKVTNVDNIEVGPDTDRVLREFVAAGNKLIFTTSFGFMDGTVKAAGANAKVTFYHCSGYKTAPNLSVYNTRIYEAVYLAGVMAGKMSKTGKLGYVAPFPIPEIVRNINAFEAGAKSVNPKVTTTVIWVNTWFDVSKEKQAAEALIGQGADVLMQNTSSSSVIKAAEEKGLYAVGIDSDRTAMAPKAVLASTIPVWGPYYERMIQASLDGKPLQAPVFGGFKDGMVDVVGINSAVPAETVAQVNKLKADMTAGKFHPFAGPVKAQDGSVKVPAGRNMSDEELSGINWFIEGVNGTVPTK
jgi:simple sugar transport system substrate-binding protein